MSGEGTRSSSFCPWQYQSARESLEQSKLNEAIEHYRDAYVNRVLTNKKLSPEELASHVQFVHSRMGMCEMAAERMAEALLSMKDVFDQVPGEDEETEGDLQHTAHAFLFVAIYFLNNRQQEKSLAVAIKGGQLFPEFKEVFDLIISRCLKDEPELFATDENTFSKETLYQKLCQDPPEEASAELRASERCRKPSVLMKRAAWCLETKRNTQAMTCLQELAALEELPQDEKIMYQFCVLMAGMMTGSVLDPAVTQKGLEALRQEHPNFLEIYSGLAEVLVKQKLYDDADRIIRTGLKMNSDGECRMFPWQIPLVHFFQNYSEESIVDALLRKLLILVETSKLPDATCRFEGCLELEQGGKREIHLANGESYNTVVCSDRCLIDFHTLCWRRAKDDRGNTSAGCFTPGNLVAHVE